MGCSPTASRHQTEFAWADVTRLHDLLWHLEHDPVSPIWQVDEQKMSHAGEAVAAADYRIVHSRPSANGLGSVATAREGAIGSHCRFSRAELNDR